MATHPAVVTTAIHAPLEILQVPTVTPETGEVRVRVEWTASTPLDLHQADGGLLVKHPQVLGDGIAGTVVEVGLDVQNLSVGDKVTLLILIHTQETDRHRSSASDGGNERKRLIRFMPPYPSIFLER